MALMTKRDRTGRVRQSAQDNGAKKIPVQTRGQITGLLLDSDIPPGLGDHGSIFWLEARESMEKMGILERADMIALRMASEAWETYVSARDRIGDQHILSNDRGGHQRNPEYLTLEHSQAVVMKFLMQLGLTPAARAKFAKPEEEDPIQKLMNAKGVVSA